MASSIVKDLLILRRPVLASRSGLAGGLVVVALYLCSVSAWAAGGSNQNPGAKGSEQSTGATGNIDISAWTTNHNHQSTPVPGGGNDGGGGNSNDASPLLNCGGGGKFGGVGGGAACAFLGAATAVPQNSPPPANWQQQLQQLINNVEGQLSVAGGTIGADPARDRGLVNLPQCYWLEGASNPTVTMTLPLTGAPGPGGQTVDYLFVVTASRSSLSWDFGDKDNQTAAAPTACGSHDGLVAHKYTRISAEAGGRYEVQASGTYTVTVTEYWSDSFGVQSQPLDLGLAPITVQTPPIGVTIGQLEGVPQGG